MEDSTLSCDAAERAIARWAGDDSALDAGTRTRLEAHLQRCAQCRAALETQRDVAARLRARPVDRVSPQFAARLAARLDEASGWFGVADWRAWTLRLTPVAALLAALVLLGSSQSDPGLTLDDWTLASADSSSAATMLLQSDVTSDVLIESIVVGDQPAASGGTDDAGK